MRTLKRFLFSICFLYPAYGHAVVGMSPPLDTMSIQIEEADIENGQDISSTVDFCLYSDVTDPTKGDGLFRIKYQSNTGIDTVLNQDDSNFSLPYSVGVAIGAGQTSGFVPLTHDTLTSNDTPLALGTVPAEDCNSGPPNMTLQMTISGSALAAARSGAYGGGSTLTLAVEEPT